MEEEDKPYVNPHRIPKQLQNVSSVAVISLFNKRHRFPTRLVSLRNMAVSPPPFDEDEEKKGNPKPLDLGCKFKSGRNSGDARGPPLSREAIDEDELSSLLPFKHLDINRTMKRITLMKTADPDINVVYQFEVEMEPKPKKLSQRLFWLSLAEEDIGPPYAYDGEKYLYKFGPFDINNDFDLERKLRPVHGYEKCELRITLARTMETGCRSLHNYLDYTNARALKQLDQMLEKYELYTYLSGTDFPKWK